MVQIWIDGRPVSRSAKLAQAAVDFADMLDDAAEIDPEFDRETELAITDEQRRGREAELALVEEKRIENEKREADNQHVVYDLLSKRFFDDDGDDEMNESDNESDTDYIDPFDQVPADFGLCADCGVDTIEIDEYYTVQSALWETVIPADKQQHMICIGCLETRLGRKLNYTDFIEAPVNYYLPRSERLLDRLGEWFRVLDGPFNTSEDRFAAVEEVLRRADAADEIEDKNNAKGEQ